MRAITLRDFRFELLRNFQCKLFGDDSHPLFLGDKFTKNGELALRFSSQLSGIE